MSLFVPPAPLTGVAPAPQGTHDCYLSYLSTGQLRLDRFGGSKIMIAGNRETIPATGMLFNAAAGFIGYQALYVWCGTNGGVPGAPLYLAADAADPVIDASGMPVHPTYPYLTLVGRFIPDAAGNFQMTANVIGVASFWNRRLRAVNAANVQTTGSTSPVELHGGNRLTCVGFAGDALRCMTDGFCNNDTQNGYTYSKMTVVGVSDLTGLGQHQATYPSAYGPICLHCDYTYPNGNNVNVATTLVGWVNAGVGSWWPNCSMMTWG
jgi:hypothetical protein